MSINITTLNSDDSNLVAKIAVPIWHQHYDPIIGEQQVNYMLKKFQSSKAIKLQIEEGYEYFQVHDNSELVGYFSILVKDGCNLFISKFYLSEKVRGKGFGRSMLQYIENLAQDKSCAQLKLTVNKYNPAYAVYLKLGFVKDGSAKFDIGNGYIMDDYLMSKPC